MEHFYGQETNPDVSQGSDWIKNRKFTIPQADEKEDAAKSIQKNS